MNAGCGTRVVFANHGEFVSPFLDADFPPRQVDIWRDGTTDLSDTALYWAQGDALIVVPGEVDANLLMDVRSFLGATVDVVRTAGDPTQLSDCVAQDPDAMVRLRRLAGAELLAWGLTPGLARFLRTFEDLGFDHLSGGVPSPDLLWLVQTLDSKPGFRIFAEQLSREDPAIRVPPGFIVPTLATALQAAQDQFFSQGHGAVVKAARGTAGYSTYVLEWSASLGEQRRTLQRRESLARFDAFWHTGPVVVERFIGGVADQSPTTVTVCVRVANAHNISIEYVATMLVRDQVRYSGAVLGHGAVPPTVAADVGAVARRFGTALAQRGFTGLFDLDVVVDTEGLLWVCEMNVRRASPSHLRAIAERAHGASWATEGAVLGRDYLHVRGTLHLTYPELRSILAEFGRRSPSSTRVVITHASSSLKRRSPWFGYALLAEDAATCASESRRFEDFFHRTLGMRTTTDASPQGATWR